MAIKYSIEDYRLCYVDEPRAYFTTQELEKQWGDDWNDTPYEHNAGLPYTPSHPEREFTNGEPNWEVVLLFYDAELVTPSDTGINSAYSVEKINQGAVAWLWDKYGDSGVAIQAGTTLPEFKRLIKKAGGKIYSEDSSGATKG